MNNLTDIARHITEATQQPFEPKKTITVGGGCINQAFCVADDKRRFFVKINHADGLPMFEAEAAGLYEIGQTNTLRAPQAVCWGKDARNAWLVLDYLELNQRGSGNVKELGARLAAMHRVHARQFGWVRDNTIGSTPQINAQDPYWVSFWRIQRLGYQLKLAERNGHHGKLLTLGERLLEDCDQFFTDYTPAPSLLHGDLWSGNFSYDNTGQPVVFDPAVYYGDREADIAMTELFGGFSREFYSAYRHEYPLDSGYNSRRVLYNLYHILNHLNLFGGGYRQQAEQMMDSLLAEIR
ncbi:Fructosamine-3-kinase [Nitrosomonas sp. Nm51]|uniref:fructosamine kinase family protein n=1 Tax=Nitrosomonas sp. Nm51 TaxID=133720 RepID=UPI0008B13DA0|nr:fructosamine kinase family protein [Nitrosomonas sp. Nm51]SEQ78392.1 Fructosamine-3-kinase [Nitrosomonas sp. Nm51]